MEKELNLDVLKDLNIPEIKLEDIDKESTEDFEQDEFQNLNITEVESIESIIKPKDTVENTEETTTEQTTETTEENTEETDPVKAIAEWQHNIGIFDFVQEDYDKYEDKEEYFKDKFIEKAKSLATESLPDVIKELVNNYADGVPLDELINVKSNQQRLDNITDEILKENTDLQEDLVVALLQNQGYEEDEIKTKLEKYKDNLMMEDESKIALKKLKKQQEQYEADLIKTSKEQELLNQKKAKENLDNLKKSIQEAETFINGVKLNAESKEKLFNGITKRDRDGLTEMDKKMKDKNVQLAVAQFVLQLDTKLDAIKRDAVTQSVGKLKETVNTTKEKKEKTVGVDMSIVREGLKRIKTSNKF